MKKSTKTKIVGYLFRLGAVCVWGIYPIIIRHTSIVDLNPILRIGIWSMVTAILAFCYAVLRFALQHSKKSNRIKFKPIYNYFFWALIITQFLFSVFHHYSLMFTSATNLTLFINFAPILGLLILFFTSRKEIPYLSKDNTFIAILAVFYN